MSFGHTNVEIPVLSKSQLFWVDSAQFAEHMDIRFLNVRPSIWELYAKMHFPWF